MAPKPRLVIVGAGLGGCAVVLDAKLPKIADITIVDTKDYFEARFLAMRPAFIGFLTFSLFQQFYITIIDWVVASSLTCTSCISVN